MRYPIFFLFLFAVRLSVAQEPSIQIIRGQKAEVDRVVQQIELANRMRAQGYEVVNGSALQALSETQLIDFFNAESVRKQLEFTESQIDQFKTLRKEYVDAYNKIHQDFPELKNRDLPLEARKALNRKVNLARAELKEDFNRRVKESLIPRQISMVKTLKFRSIVRSFGFAQALTNPLFKEELKVSEKQAKEIQKIRTDLKAAMQKKMQEMKTAAENQMREILDAKQRKALKEIEGESLDESKRP